MVVFMLTLALFFFSFFFFYSGWILLSFLRILGVYMVQRMVILVTDGFLDS